MPFAARLEGLPGVFIGEVARDVAREVAAEFGTEVNFCWASFCAFSRSLAAISYYKMNKWHRQSKSIGKNSHSKENSKS